MKKTVISLFTIWLLVLTAFFIPITSPAAYIVDSDPDNGATDVSVETLIIIRFNTTMDQNSVEENLEITSGLGSLECKLEWSNDDRELTITPVERLDYSRNYTISIVGAVDIMGDPLENSTICFETESEPKEYNQETLEPSSSLLLLIIMIILGALTGIWLGYVIGRGRAKSK